MAARFSRYVAIGDSFTEGLMDFGADSESITHTLKARGNGESGTSAVLSRTGESFKVTGKGTMTDDGKVSATGVPYTVTVTCASLDW